MSNYTHNLKWWIGESCRDPCVVNGRVGLSTQEYLGLAKAAVLRMDHELDYYAQHGRLPSGTGAESWDRYQRAAVPGVARVDVCWSVPADLVRTEG